MKETVCVTGSSGFIGSHLVEALRNNNKLVVCVDKNPPKIKHNDVIYQTVDISQSDFQYDYPPPDVLYHLAADTTLTVKDQFGWFHGSKSAFYNNSVSTFNSLLKIYPKKIVFSSTASIYGEVRNAHEDTPISIVSQYGYSKLLSESIIKYSTIPFVIFRFGTVVGPRGKTFPNRLVYCAINNISVDIFHQGMACRDIIDVRDVVSGLLNINNLDNNIYNLSVGKEIFIGDLSNIIRDMAIDRGYKPKFTFVSDSVLGYVKESTLDTSKIRDTGWFPEYNINKTLESLFVYYEQNKNVVIPLGV